jgi:hypothetical protein
MIGLPILSAVLASKPGVSHAELGDYSLHCEGNPRLLFTEKEPNNERLFGKPNASPYVKDGINNYVVAGRQEAINPNYTGIKAAAHYQRSVGAGATEIIRLRLSNAALGVGGPFGTRFDQIIEARRREADAFYRAITPAGVGEDAANVIRQALAGMLWSKQYFFIDIAAGVLRTEPSGLFGEIHHDRPGLEDRDRGAAAHRLVVDNRRHPAVRRNLQKFGSELVPAADIDRFDRVWKPQFLQKNDDLLAVSGRPEIEVDHWVFSCSSWQRAEHGGMPVAAL